jgi:hypothetical protein
MEGTGPASPAPGTIDRAATGSASPSLPSSSASRRGRSPLAWPDSVRSSWPPEPQPPVARRVAPSPPHRRPGTGAVGVGDNEPVRAPYEPRAGLGPRGLTHAADKQVDELLVVEDRFEFASTIEAVSPAGRSGCGEAKPRAEPDRAMYSGSPSGGDEAIPERRTLAPHQRGRSGSASSCRVYQPVGSTQGISRRRREAGRAAFGGRGRAGRGGPGRSRGRAAPSREADGGRPGPRAARVDPRPRRRAGRRPPPTRG